MTVTTEGAGAAFPVKVRCASCDKRISKTDPRLFTNGEYTCADCDYYISRGQTPPNAIENNR